MWFGVTAGFVSALLQSTSYLFSRRFVLKHRNPGLLVVYSQLVMFGFGLLTLAAAGMTLYSMGEYVWQNRAVLGGAKWSRSWWPSARDC